MMAFLGTFWPVIAAGSVAIPVVIHLINQRRYKIVPWAAMRFLLAAQKQTRKRMRIEQLLLLLTRVLIVAMIVFAMASVMPWAEAVWANPRAQAIFAFLGIDAGGAAATRPQRIHHVMVLDASLSMNQTAEGGQSAFERARQLMLKKIQDGQSGDGYSVLLLRDSPTWLIGQPSQTAQRVMDEIKNVPATHGNSSLPVALSMVAAKLNEAKQRFNGQAVYFFSDMQRTTWQAAAAADQRTEAEHQKSAYLEIQRNATCVFVDVGPTSEAGNLAVTDLQFDPFRWLTAEVEIPLDATVKNFSNEVKRDVRIELLIGKARANGAEPAQPLRVVDQDTKSILAGESATFRFKKVRFPAAGLYTVRAKIAGDALEQDDARTIVVNVRESVQVLLVNGKAAAVGSDPATQFLRLALNPARPGLESKAWPLRPRVITPSQFSEMSDAELDAHDAVFWCDVGAFGVNEVRKLDGYLRRGGGFLVSLGDNSAKYLDRYNNELWKNERGILPARLMKVVQAPRDHHFYLENGDDNAYNLPPLAKFRDDYDKPTLSAARFRQFVQVVVPEGKARTILSFMPEGTGPLKAKLPTNSPALVEWNPPLARAPRMAGEPGKTPRIDRQPARCRGKVILFTSTLNFDWNSWIASPSYLPMMQELTRLATSGRLREQSGTVGGVLEEYLPGGAEVDVTLHFPAGMPGPKSARVHTQMFEDVNLFRWNDTDFSGIYRLETDKGQEIPFAVNVPTATSDQKGSESDLTRVDEARLKEYYPEWRFQIVRNPLDATVAGGPENVDPLPTIKDPLGPLFANVALLLVLGLLFVEVVLAWAFGHYTVTEGALSQAMPGRTSLIIAAVIAVMSTLLFTAGAAIVFRERMTGDFLGDLPDIARTWFEGSLGIDPPQPGEGKNWRYQTLPFLFGLPGGEYWWSIVFTIAALAIVFFTYKAEAPRVPLGFKLLLGALRVYLILTTVWFLLPRGQILYERKGYPDMVILIDDTRSMGEPDAYQDERVLARVQKLSAGIRARLQQELPERINRLENEIAAKTAAAGKDADLKADVDALRQRLQYWTKQRDHLAKDTWRPSRLQLVQEILQQPEPHWLKTILSQHKTKVHIFHLDINGRATKLFDARGDAGDLLNANDPVPLERAAKAIDRLEPVGTESRLGTALRQAIDHYRGTGLSCVIMLTDGVTTRDDTIAQTANYAAQKGIALFLVGVGDEHQLRDLRLHDLNVDDAPYVGDRLPFEVRLTGVGYKDLTVTVVLKLKDKAGKEKIVDRKPVKVDPNGKSIKVQLSDQPKVVGPHRYIIEVEPPKMEANEKPIPPANLHLERIIDVIDTKLIKVLCVEGQPRYEFRYLKFLLERESLDLKKKKSIELKVVLLDADPGFAKQDKTALETFPPTLDELNKYDVILFGDCDPNHKIIKNRLRDIAAWAKGEDARGKKAAKAGGGILFIAGSAYNPHRYKNTPLADILPVAPTADQPPKDAPIKDRYSPELTAAGKNHPIFRFSQNDEDNRTIWNRLTPFYWSASRYKVKLAAEVLAVHPKQRAESKDREGDDRFPLVATQYVGTGRSMFFGFDETWRWRKDDENRYEAFWIQTVRYLSRGRSTRTDLRLDQQTPYRLGQPIKVIVQFPDNTPGGKDQKGPKVNEKTEVKVTVEYRPTDAKDAPREGAVESLTLSKVEGSWGTYEGTLNRTRDGKYRFRLTNPDVSSTQPDGEKPSSEATVVLPPGELDRLRMNYQEMTHAAQLTHGQFVRIDEADSILEQLPQGEMVPIGSTRDPTLLWNQWWVFVLVLFLITSEWVLRKMKHLL